MIKALICNGNDRNRRAWLSFPTTPGRVRAVFEGIGLTGENRDNYYISECAFPIEDMEGCEEFATVNDLNYLAVLLDELSDEQFKVYAAAVPHALHMIDDYINLTYHVNEYSLDPLGRLCGFRESDLLAPYAGEVPEEYIVFDETELPDSAQGADLTGAEGSGIFSVTLEGHDGGAEILALPTTREEASACLAALGGAATLDNAIPELGVWLRSGRLTALNEMQMVACRLKELGGDALRKLRAVIAAYAETFAWSVAPVALVNLAYNLDCYDYFPAIHTHEDLARYILFESGECFVPSRYADALPLAMMGRRVAAMQGGVLTGYGYVVRNKREFTDAYWGIGIRKEYRIVNVPNKKTASRGKKVHA